MTRPSPMRRFSSKERRKIKFKLIEKYGPYCQLCLLDDKSQTEALIDLVIINEDKSWSVDHITPMSRGGKNIPSNMWPAHKGCNTERGNDELREGNRG